MPEELRFLLRSGLFGVLVGGAYWFISYEVAGTLLLVGLGLSALLLVVLLWRDMRRNGRSLGRPSWRWLILPPESAESGTTDESGRLPGHSLAPVTLGVGIALGMLGLVFGPWLVAAAVAPVFFGLRGWLREAMAEYGAVERG
jgi:hypothetical protein